MTDFWPNCGYHLLRKDADGRLQVTDDYLRLYYQRPELAPAAGGAGRTSARCTRR